MHVYTTAPHTTYLCSVSSREVMVKKNMENMLWWCLRAY